MEEKVSTRGYGEGTVLSLYVITGNRLFVRVVSMSLLVFYKRGLWNRDVVFP
jgi:hypothetical protein